MSLPVIELLTAIALIFVIEGLIYALFPDRIKQMMAIALATDPRSLRGFGLGMVVVGAVLIWIIQQLH